MRHRMVVALLALVGALVSAYLLLFKLGLIGRLACGVEGCDRVQASRWAELLGVPVAAYGVAGFAVLLAIALVGVGEAWVERAEPTRWIARLSGLGVAFSVYLTYLELFRIRAICLWCLVSAGLITAIFLVALAGRRR